MEKIFSTNFFTNNTKRGIEYELRIFLIFRENKKGFDNLFGMRGDYIRHIENSRQLV
jgi:hypothetical protein